MNKLIAIILFFTLISAGPPMGGPPMGPPWGGGKPTLCGNPPRPCVIPIDGGIGFLIVAAALIGIKRIKQK